ncbi:MAG: hypothetical protein ACPG6V_10540 [Flavobacteriales bacterium]
MQKTFITKRILISLIFLLSIETFCQVGIGTTTPNSSSILDIDSDEKGILIPRVELINVDDPNPIANPTESLLVYNNGNHIPKGFYYWIQNKWVAMYSESNVKTTSVQTSSKTINDAYQNIEINAGVGTHIMRIKYADGDIQVFTLNIGINSGQVFYLNTGTPSSVNHIIISSSGHADIQLRKRGANGNLEMRTTNPGDTVAIEISVKKMF